MKMIERCHMQVNRGREMVTDSYTTGESRIFICIDLYMACGGIH